MATPTWHFRKMGPDEINQDPFQGEFFNQSPLAERLVRESLQNSLDARRGNETVRVRFVFSGDETALPPDTARPYLDNLRPHLRNLDPIAPEHATDAPLSEVFVPYDIVDRPMPFLLIEDFGTTGLLGEIDANPQHAEGNNFWGFFRSIGISPKGDDDAGSWGLGKWVFPDASLIHSFIALTRRPDEDRSLMMGMSIVKTHQLPDGSRYPYYGHFAEMLPQAEGGVMQMPVDSAMGGADVIQRFEGDVGAQRKHEPGLSVAVLYPNPDITAAVLARAVVTQYFLAVIRGILEVEILAPGQRTWRITASTIDQELKYLTVTPELDSLDREEESPEAVQHLLDLARWAESLDKDRHYTIIDIPKSNRDQDFIQPSELEALRQSFNRGERVAFRAVTKVQKQEPGSPRVESECDIYIERDDTLPQGHDYFVRGFLHIPYMDHFAGVQVKARALLWVDESTPLGHLLRASEGPAHNEWQKNAPRLRDGWRAGRARVEEVRNAPARIVRLLSATEPERQKTLLADVFSVSGRDEPDQDVPREPNGPGPDAPDPPVITDTAPLPLSIERLKDGFRVRKQEQGADSKYSKEWEVRFAYDVARFGASRAFSQFKQAVKNGYQDFSLIEGGGTLNVSGEGCTANTLTHNALRLTIERDDFELVVGGFDDVRRDIVVRLSDLGEGES